MAYISIEDVLGSVRQYEKKLEKYYEAIRDESNDNGVRLLTYYFSRHRNHLSNALEGYDSAAIQRIKHVKLKYDVNFDPEKSFHLLKIPPNEIRGRQLLEASVEYDMELINLYKKILEQPLGPEPASFIESLLRVEERDIVMIKKMIAMDYF
jgi:hypothetical protein